MSYTLSAFIGKTAALEKQALELPTTKSIHLSQGFSMLLVSETLAAIPGSDVPVEPFYTLSSKLFELGKALSATGPVGFLDIELFGGHGERTAVLWQNQEVAFGPVMSEDDSSVTNQLLALLGVQKLDFHDEFDALGLGRYRSTNQWLAHA